MKKVSFCICFLFHCVVMKPQGKATDLFFGLGIDSGKATLLNEMIADSSRFRNTPVLGFDTRSNTSTQTPCFYPKDNVDFLAEEVNYRYLRIEERQTSGDGVRCYLLYHVNYNNKMTKKKVNKNIYKIIDCLEKDFGESKKETTDGRTTRGTESWSFAESVFVFSKNGKEKAVLIFHDAGQKHGYELSLMYRLYK